MKPYKRDAECFCVVNERVQVPTGSHSQTAVTGWSNYRVAGTHQHGRHSSPPGRERERERSPNPRLPTWRAPGSRLIPQLQSHTHTFCSLRARTQAAARYGGPPCVDTCPGRALVSCQTHLLANPQSMWDDSIVQVCARVRGHRRTVLPWNNDSTFDPLTHRWIFTCSNIRRLGRALAVPVINARVRRPICVCVCWWDWGADMGGLVELKGAFLLNEPRLISMPLKRSCKSGKVRMSHLLCFGLSETKRFHRNLRPAASKITSYRITTRWNLCVASYTESLLRAGFL